MVVIQFTHPLLIHYLLLREFNVERVSSEIPVRIEFLLCRIKPPDEIFETRSKRVVVVIQFTHPLLIHYLLLREFNVERVSSEIPVRIEFLLCRIKPPDEIFETRSKRVVVVIQFTHPLLIHYLLLREFNVERVSSEIPVRIEFLLCRIKPPDEIFETRSKRVVVVIQFTHPLLIHYLLLREFNVERVSSEIPVRIEFLLCRIKPPDEIFETRSKRVVVVIQFTHPLLIHYLLLREFNVERVSSEIPVRIEFLLCRIKPPDEIFETRSKRVVVVIQFTHPLLIHYLLLREFNVERVSSEIPVRIEFLLCRIKPPDEIFETRSKRVVVVIQFTHPLLIHYLLLREFNVERVSSEIPVRIEFLLCRIKPPDEIFETRSKRVVVVIQFTHPHPHPLRL